MIFFPVSQRTFTEGGPQFSNQDSRLDPVIEKAKNTFYLAISISVTSVVLISKGQLCPTSSGCCLFTVGSCEACQEYPARTNNISGLLNLTNVATGGALSGVGSMCFLSGRLGTLSQV